MNWQFLNNKRNTTIGQSATILALPHPFVITCVLFIMNGRKFGMFVLHSDSTPQYWMNRSLVGPRVSLVIVKNLLPLLEFKLQFFQPVANKFTTLSWLLVISDGNVICSTKFNVGQSILIMSISAMQLSQKSYCKGCLYVQEILILCSCTVQCLGTG